MEPSASTVICCTILMMIKAAIQIGAAVDIVLCKEPVLTTVAVDEPAHRFFPYFVQLHQCQGSWHHESPNIKHCVATKSDPIKITAYNTEKSWKKTEITMYNHTRCGPACKASANDCDPRVQRWNKQTCTCDCLYLASPPPESVISRKKGFRWNAHLCRYECGGPHAICSFKKTWNKEKCGCVCDSFYKLRCEDDNKYMDSETCECKNHRGYLVGGERPGFLTYFGSQMLLAFLVLAILVIGGLSARLCYIQRKLISPKAAKSEGSDVSDDGSDFPSQSTFESAV